MTVISNDTDQNTPSRLLAIEASGQAGSVALFRGEELILRRCLDPNTRSAQSLAPAIAAVLRQTGWRPADIGVIAVTTGPGSFTGLRVGVTTAKVLAYTLGAKLIGVNTLDAVVHRLRPAVPTWAILDAQRGEFFAGSYTHGESGWHVAFPTAIVSRAAWLASLAPGDCVTGPALTSLSSQLPSNVTCAPQEAWLPTAESVGRLALDRVKVGHFDDPWSLTPHYYRRSAAEEKWEQEHGSFPSP